MPYEPVRLEGGEEWLWRPWIAGKCEYRHMVDGTLGLYDIAVMNDLLDVKDENDARAQAALRAAQERK